MPNRKQKRAKRMRARAHQKELRGTVKVETHGKHAIEVPRGPRPTTSHRKSDPYKHGHRLDAQGMNAKALREIGIEDPTPSNCREFAKLVRVCGGNVSLAQTRLKDDLQKAYKRAAQQHRDQTVHGFSATEAKTGERVDPVDIKPPNKTLDTLERMKNDPEVMDGLPRALAGCPTIDEFASLVKQAKRRRRGLTRFMESRGYALASPDADPIARESWVLA